MSTVTSVWQRSQFCGWLLAVGVVLALALPVFAAVDAEYRAVCLYALLAPAAFLACGAVRVTVAPQGVTVASVLLPFLRRRFPYHRLQHASARWTRPTEIGGWGYRWQPGMRAVSLREGDALWLEFKSGSQFVVTVDDAGTAAELVLHYLRTRARDH
ncbi:hypothetical protein I5Q34_01690 [Streptomyces sp. AV19]|uniref:hypothetical protein n=1 Tax=Streptomyces sp. AV19 TaxID=2793068 RepID=UPI0018FE39A9|nr:hypothetical protein [Streptomyces sp. AV19]MBH1933013.1 hypothetical protein [Streptomyces sp. AV19]MDG4531726.1 hypothetical protein [Streptomyces sp. AV19]